MIDGCREWRRHGLAPPAIVRDATDAYFGEQDTVGQWIDECIGNGGPDVFARNSELFASWKGWCEARNFRTGTVQALSEALTDRDYTKARDTAGQRGFRGIVVKR